MAKAEKAEIIRKSGKVIETRPNGTRRVYTLNLDPTMTQQQFQDQTDVNYIMNKYDRTGVIDHLRANQGVFADVTHIGSYQECLDKVMQAEAAFEMLPSELRTRLGNDPQKFIEYLKDSKNDEEAIQLGLKVKLPETPADKVPDSIDKK